MLNLTCKKHKGKTLTNDECYQCFKMQMKNHFASRPICKKENITDTIEIELPVEEKKRHRRKKTERKEPRVKNINAEHHTFNEKVNMVFSALSEKFSSITDSEKTNNSKIISQWDIDNVRVSLKKMRVKETGLKDGIRVHIENINNGESISIGEYKNKIFVSRFIKYINKYLTTEKE